MTGRLRQYNEKQRASRPRLQRLRGLHSQAVERLAALGAYFIGGYPFEWIGRKC